MVESVSPYDGRERVIVQVNSGPIGTYLDGQLIPELKRRQTNHVNHTVPRKNLTTGRY